MSLLSRSDRLLCNHNPELAKEWDYEKNGDLTPLTVTYGSGKKVWWLCSSGHEYEATVSNRSLGKGCPYCAGQKVSPEKSLEHVNPDLTKQWHQVKNKNLRPSDVLPFSHKKVWWQCSRYPDHFWKAAVSSRSKGHGCPLCQAQTSLPELRIYTELKALLPNVINRARIKKKEADIYIPDLNLAIEFDGSYFHKDAEEVDIKKNELLRSVGIELLRVRVRPLKRISSHDVLVDEGELDKSDVDSIVREISRMFPEHTALSKYLQKDTFIAENEYKKYVAYLPNPFPENALTNTDPKLVPIWHKKLNLPLTPENFTAGSGKKIWWQCDKSIDHVWEASINQIRRGRRCPFCASKRISKEKSLAILYPEISSEWDQKGNSPITPSEVLAYSNKTYSWICSKGHHFDMKVAERTKAGRGCTVCEKQKLQNSSVAALYPDLEKEWNQRRNGTLHPEDMLPMSQKKIWWICEKGHEWQAVIASRTSGTGCPICSGRVADSTNNLAVEYPDIAREFDTVRNGCDPSKYKSGSGKKVWWKCSLNPDHRWEAVIGSRTKQKTGCPICWNERRSKKIKSNN